MIKPTLDLMNTVMIDNQQLVRYHKLMAFFLKEVLMHSDLKDNHPKVYDMIPAICTSINVQPIEVPFSFNDSDARVFKENHRKFDSYSKRTINELFEKNDHESKIESLNDCFQEFYADKDINGWELAEVYCFREEMHYNNYGVGRMIELYHGDYVTFHKIMDCHEYEQIAPALRKMKFNIPLKSRDVKSRTRELVYGEFNHYTTERNGVFLDYENELIKLHIPLKTTRIRNSSTRKYFI